MKRCTGGVQGGLQGAMSHCVVKGAFSCNYLWLQYECIHQLIIEFCLFYFYFFIDIKLRSALLYCWNLLISKLRTLSPVK